MRWTPSAFGSSNLVRDARYSKARPFTNTPRREVIIIATTQILALIFGRIRQPRVIAEIIGGVLLGPTVMGRIPNFKDSIFPGV